MAHNRKLVIGAVALVKARVHNSIEAFEEARDYVEEILISFDWLKGAPFKWVGLIVRYGLKNDEFPAFQNVNKKNGDLPIAIEVDVNDILEIHKNKDEFALYIKKLTFSCLLAVAEKYKLSKKELELELVKLSAI
ncbi:hypothetical protein C2869_05650 [Saccharobesus litoralis]|uniref:Uncharacterized protein n=1 Tax=Saccharobesus litoralis TaxID=2172099 RepID=A0A2S0VP15_9ALTE|nr:Imm39 family immunity protein [Saccharobesus litoralis]AWB65956.1 hypothetical protein C2869_05650 [Saccharobesus litoralis]